MIKETPSAQDVYEAFLQKYVDFTEQIRILQRLMRPLEDRLEVDVKRHNVHTELLRIGSSLGKQPAEVGYDILFTEGNLMEYDVDAPFVRLPLVEKYFRLNEAGDRIIFTQSDFFRGVRYRIQPPGASDVPISGCSLEAKELKKRDLRKWQKRPFGAIIFSQYSWDHGYTSAPILHVTRMKRREALAQDYSLNLLTADDMGGHYFITPRFIYGVEVPLFRLGEIAGVMRAFPEKYWLTPDELSYPYRQEFLVREDREMLFSRLYDALRKASAEDSGSWCNFLRVYDALQQMGPYEDTRIREPFWTISLRAYIARFKIESAGVESLLML